MGFWSELGKVGLAFAVEAIEAAAKNQREQKCQLRPQGAYAGNGSGNAGLGTAHRLPVANNRQDDFALVLTDEGVSFPGVLDSETGESLDLDLNFIVSVEPKKANDGADCVSVVMVGGVEAIVPLKYVDVQLQKNALPEFYAQSNEAFQATCEEAFEKIAMGQGGEYFDRWSAEMHVADDILVLLELALLNGNGRICVDTEALAVRCTTIGTIIGNVLRTRVQRVSQRGAQALRDVRFRTFFEVGVPLVVFTDSLLGQLLEESKTIDRKLLAEVKSDIKSRSQDIEFLLPYLPPSAQTAIRKAQEEDSDQPEDEIYERVVEAVRKQMNGHVHDITLDSRFYEDLMFDELDHVEFVMKLEAEFGRAIPEEEDNSWRTVRDAVDFLRRSHT